MNPRDLTHYAAGLFDANGVVVIGVSKRHGGTPSHWLQVAVTAEHRAPLELLRNEFKGHIVLPRQLGRRTVWRVLGHEAVVFLRRIRPHLLVKGSHADIAITFQDSKHDLRSLSIEARAQELTNRAALKIRLQQLTRPRRSTKTSTSPSLLQTRFGKLLGSD